MNRYTVYNNNQVISYSCKLSLQSSCSFFKRDIVFFKPSFSNPQTIEYIPETYRDTFPFVLYEPEIFKSLSALKC